MSAATDRFAGKTVIVTGAGSGIGRATAVRVAGESARVVATDVDQDRLAALADELGNAGLRTVAGDIVDPDVIRAILAEAGERVDGPANVAGIMDGFLPPAEVDDATGDRVMAVNLTGPMRLTRAVLPGMIALAAAIVWLLSEDSANVNGAIVPSDGGWSTV